MNRIFKNKKMRYAFLFLWLIFLFFMIIYPSRLLALSNFLLTFIFTISFYSKCETREELRLLSKKYANQQRVLTAIYKSTTDLIYLKDKNLKYLSCNSAFLKMLKKDSQEDVINKNDFQLIPKDIAENLRKNDESVLKTLLPTKYNQKYKLEGPDFTILETIKTPIIEEGKFLGILGISRDITDTYNLQKALSRKQFQLNAILDNMPYIAYIKDLEGTILFCNDKVKQIIKKLNLREPIKSYLLFNQYYVDEIKKEDNQITTTKNSIQAEKFFDLENEPKFYKINKAPIFNELNEVVGISVIAEDITSEKSLEEHKETFIATLTHDLKTPTFAQIKALKLLAEGKLGELNEKQKDIIGQTINSCEYMSGMIATIIDTYTNHKGNKIFNFSEFDLKLLTEKSICELRVLSEEKNISIFIKTDCKNLLITADELEIKRVIINLISNAIYYSGKYTTIEILMRKNNKEIEFKIKNNGNIDKEELSKVFERYYTNGKKFNSCGHGLGLYLSRQIIERHNGKIYAEKENQDTNVFGFTIPDLKKFIKRDKEKSLI